MVAMGGRIGERDLAEDVGGEQLLSVALLGCLLPVGGSELEDAWYRPARDEAEQIAQVAPRLDVVQLATGEQRDKGGVDLCGSVAADEQPVFAPDDLATQCQLGHVVVDGQLAILQELLQRLTLVASV